MRHGAAGADLEVLPVTVPADPSAPPAAVALLEPPRVASPTTVVRAAHPVLVATASTRTAHAGLGVPGTVGSPSVPLPATRTTVLNLVVEPLEPHWWPAVVTAARRAAEAVHDRWMQAVEPVRVVAARHRVVIGAHRGISPRRHSEVRHRVRCAPADALRAVSARTRVADPRARRLALCWDPARLRYDRGDRVHRCPGRLQLPWSWPALPVWLGVHEWSTDAAVVTLSLRSRRRLRYPRRYFHLAHRSLDLVQALLDPAGGHDPRQDPTGPGNGRDHGDHGDRADPMRDPPGEGDEMGGIAGSAQGAAARRSRAAGSWR